MTLVAYFDLELHQMDVKPAFLNGNIDETIYMVQPENFVSSNSKSMVCKLKKFIYGLKQASRRSPATAPKTCCVMIVELKIYKRKVQVSYDYVFYISCVEHAMRLTTMRW